MYLMNDPVQARCMYHVRIRQPCLQSHCSYESVPMSLRAWRRKICKLLLL